MSIAAALDPSNTHSTQNLLSVANACSNIPLNEPELLELLKSIAPEEPYPLFIITDPNKDPDDLAALTLARGLAELGFVRPCGVVTALGDDATRLRRAQFAKAVLDELGLSEVPVAAGATSTDVHHDEYNLFHATKFLAPISSLRSNAQTLMRSALEAMEPHSGIILVIASMTDLAEFLKNPADEALFKAKIREVAIMGGVAEENGLAVPDPKAFNHRADLPSAQFAYEKIQSLGIPLITFGRSAAYAASVPPCFFENMAETGHPVGELLNHCQQAATESHWNRALKGNSAHISAERFLTSYTGLTANDPDFKSLLGRTTETPTNERSSIWNYIVRLHQYDPLTLLAAIPEIRPLLFEERRCLGASMSVIDDTEVKNPALCRTALSAIIKHALRTSMPIVSGKIMNVAKSRTAKANEYPERMSVPPDATNWKISLPEYKPPYYVSPRVLAQDSSKVPNGWADPEDLRQRSEKEYFSYTGSVLLDERGFPLNPNGRTGIAGRGLLGKWGANFAADPIITRVDPESDLIQMIAIRRKDSGSPAIPGGMVDPGESITRTLERELSEETGAKLDLKNGKIIYRGIVDDPRNTDNAWMETTVAHVHLEMEQGAKVTLQAGDDAAQAAWVTLAPEMVAEMYANHGEFVRETLRQISHDPSVRLSALALDQIKAIL